MKRLIIAGIIFFIIISLCVSAGVISQETFEELKEQVEDCAEEYQSGNTDSALDLAQRLNKKWLKLEDRLSVIMNHDRIDDIRIHFSRLKAYIEAQDLAGFKSEIAQLLTLIDQLEEDEKITMHSIF